MRLDVMTIMRNVDSFAALWERRTTMQIPGIAIQLLSLPDLVLAKKTQREKKTRYTGFPYEKSLKC
jgi:hypothetical protein